MKSELLPIAGFQGQWIHPCLDLQRIQHVNAHIAQFREFSRKVVAVGHYNGFWNKTDVTV